nr:hypothetical protein [Tanacetum cinerariifolium]
MREKDNASWDWGKRTWVGRERLLGTVPVWWGCTGMAGEEGRFWAGKGVRGTVCPSINFGKIAQLVPGLLGFNFDGFGFDLWAELVLELWLNSTLAQITEHMTSITSLCEMACQFFQKKLEEKQLEEEQTAKAKNWKLPVCYDDDDDEERSNSLDDNIILDFHRFLQSHLNNPFYPPRSPITL